MATERDYYDVLGIARGASQDDIKAAYRKKAMQYHPDRNPGDEAAEEKFKEATEAFEVLSDEQKRKMYDQFGHNAFKQGGAGGPSGFTNMNFDDIFGGFGGFGGGSSGGFEDIFDTFFGGGGGRRRSGARSGAPRKQRGDDLRADVTLNLKDVLNDKNLKLKVRRNEKCDACGGSGSESGSAPQVCTTCGGTGRVRQTQGFFSIQTACPKCHGTGSMVKDPCRKCDGTGVVEEDVLVTVKIPAGVDDGMRLRVSGEGDLGPNNGIRGDLYVQIHVENQTPFEREGDDLYGELKVSFPRAVFGGDLEVETLDGFKKIHVPAGVQVGHQIRLRGYGLPNVRTKARGDLYLAVSIDVPKRPTSAEKRLLKEYAKQIGENL